MRPPATQRLLAPGKLFLMGEYAVRHGGPAAVLAVDRQACLAWRRGRRTEREGLVEQARSAAARRIDPGGRRDLASGRCAVDTRAFYSGGRKLGLGSSAAVTVAAVASVFVEAGHDIRHPAQRQRIWRLAREVHDRFQGVPGSGVDLAASIFGGLLFVLPGEAASVRRLEPGVLPAGLAQVFVWTGRPAATPRLVASVDRLQRRDPPGHRALIGEMAALSGAFLQAKSPAAAIRQVGAYGRLMQELGARAGAPIVTGPVLSLVRAARDAGGAAKPSGAGGGDFVWAVFAEDAAAAAFARSARRLGARPVALRPQGVGVHVLPGGRGGRREARS